MSIISEDFPQFRRSDFVMTIAIAIEISVCAHIRVSLVEMLSSGILTEFVRKCIFSMVLK